LPNRVEQRKDDREHGIRKLSLPAFKFNWLSENGILIGTGRSTWMKSRSRISKKIATNFVCGNFGSRCRRSTVGRVIEAGAFQDYFPCPTSVVD